MTKTIIEATEFFGDGDGRVKLELMDDGTVQVRRWTWNGEESRWTPHRFTLSPDAPLSESADRRLIDGAARRRIEAHRSPARLAVRQARKGAREAEAFLQK